MFDQVTFYQAADTNIFAVEEGGEDPRYQLGGSFIQKIPYMTMEEYREHRAALLELREIFASMLYNNLLEEAIDGVYSNDAVSERQSTFRRR